MLHIAALIVAIIAVYLLAGYFMAEKQGITTLVTKGFGPLTTRASTKVPNTTAGSFYVPAAQNGYPVGYWEPFNENEYEEFAAFDGEGEGFEEGEYEGFEEGEYEGFELEEGY